MNKNIYYKILFSVFGPMGLVWHEEGGSINVVRIFLPEEKAPAKILVKKEFPDGKEKSCRLIDVLGKQLKSFTAGTVVDFNHALLDFSVCSPFQKRVLLTEAKIPRGRVSTYGKIAGRLGIPLAARAVGHALATNPFPLIIPCHRAVRSDGSLGGFQGGLPMKRALLEQEGVEFSEKGKVITDRFFY